MPLGTTIPALPARDVAASTAFYVERLGFTVLHTDGHFSVLQRDASRIHLWESSDTSWRGRADLAA
jgi:catechol 2,3-dioxygenase-like lactoylglutathione lyase family enzyme